jgi:ubiquinone/menaquinone biosynthesis C-methylase UbiE
MDAARLGFPVGVFDTVSITNSLHHMTNLSEVLSEMVRVLKPGGTFLLAEMYRDNQTETQMTHVLLHHWWAAIDTAKGITHLETFTKEQIMELCQNLHLQQSNFFDVLDISSNPKDAGLAKELESIIDRYLQKAAGTRDEESLSKQGESLRSRIRDVGFHSATQLFMIGKK